MTRALLRAELLAQRRALGAPRIASLSRQVTDRFVSDSGVPVSSWKGLRIGFYRPFAGELDPGGLATTLLGWGAELYFPRVLNPIARTMEFALGGSQAADWRKGAYGNEEPCTSAPPLDPALLDLVFVPGVGFGLQGERLGMGVGFYDRYLPQAARALRIALAFDFQLLPKLEQESWDQRMHWIWTERRQVLLKAWSPS